VSGDPLRTLAAAAVQALATPPLPSTGLRAEYVEAGGRPEVRQV
jgi:hypothetical protein